MKARQEHPDIKTESKMYDSIVLLGYEESSQ